MTWVSISEIAAKKLQAAGNLLNAKRDPARPERWLIELSDEALEWIVDVGIKQVTPRLKG